MRKPRIASCLLPDGTRLEAAIRLTLQLTDERHLTREAAVEIRFRFPNGKEQTLSLPLPRQLLNCPVCDKRQPKD